MWRLPYLLLATGFLGAWIWALIGNKLHERAGRELPESLALFGLPLMAVAILALLIVPPWLARRRSRSGRETA